MDLGQVFTNECVAKFMISLFEDIEQGKILDPCFGNGVFIKAALEAGYTDVEGYEIDNSLYKNVKHTYSEISLYNKDFLLTPHKDKYDGIIMNPPYIRHEKIDDLVEYGITKARLQRKKIFNKLSNSANMYMYFILEAIELLKENGQLVVIFPSSWLNTRTGNNFEKLLYEKCFLVEQDFISGDVFQTDALVEVIIMKLVKKSAKHMPIVKHYSVEDGSLREYQEDIDFGDIGFNYGFGEIAKIRRGLTTGWNSAFINPNIQNKSHDLYRKIVSSPKAITGYSTKNAKTDILFSADENAQLTKQEKKYIEELEVELEKVKKPKTLYESKKAARCWYKINPVESRGIWFSYFVRNDMKFIYNDEQYMARDNFYIIYPQIDNYLAFALLNNLYTFYQLEKNGKKYGAGLLKLQRYDLENVKFPDIEMIDEKDCIELKKAAERLIVTGRSDIIIEITKLISQYANVSFQEIKEMYDKIKEQRLKKQDEK